MFSQFLFLKIKNRQSVGFTVWLEVFRFHLGKPVMLILPLQFNKNSCEVFFVSMVNVLVNTNLCIFSIADGESEFE